MGIVKHARKGIIVLSGGMDSTISLFWALSSDFDVTHALIFRYGQRHAVEIEAAERIAKLAGVEPVIMPIDIFNWLNDSALVGDGDITSKHSRAKNLPASFVPGRNLIFLTVAAMFAYKHEINNIITGVCQTDYSGYPDCRHHTVVALQSALQYGMDYQITIHTPLMWLTKMASVKMIQGFPYDYKEQCMKALSYSHTCYEGKYPPCGKCPSCILRAKGFLEASIEDPLLRRYEEETILSGEI